MPLCKFCGADRRLIKAHIIPEAFFRQLKVPGETPILVSSRKGHFKKKSPIGVYDSNILCAECEGLFAAPDNYGAKILIQEFDSLFEPVIRHGRIVAFTGKGIDQTLLQKFLVGTLWRASVSGQDYYSNVRLGPLEEMAKAAFLDPTHPEAHRFSSLLSRWQVSKERESLADAMMDPLPEKWNQVRAYRFYFGRTVAYIKADNRKFGRNFQQLSLGARLEPVAITRDFDSSKDFAAMVRVARLQARADAEMGTA
ncbi:hypothetical protein [Solimonas fluminis]|uniref:hypothetical protein n=1 Tax=Solimonas fluminis TaxID=2086571 RepID=UPI00105711B2|nr:hypothetical protein [Solimonas fluminis]